MGEEIMVQSSSHRQGTHCTTDAGSGRAELLSLQGCAQHIEAHKRLTGNKLDLQSTVQKCWELPSAGHGVW